MATKIVQPDDNLCLLQGNDVHLLSHMRKWIIVVLCLIGSMARGQRLMLTGRIIDEITESGIAGALLLDSKHQLGATTNAQGYFVLSLPFDSCIFEITSFGYKSSQLRIKLTKDDVVQVKLVRAPHQRKNYGEPRFVVPGYASGVLHPTINLQEQKQMPNMLTADIFRTSNYLPGFQQWIPGSSALHFRGTSSDRQGIYMDGVPLFNPYHGLGTFSIFDRVNTAAVTFDKAGFDPALHSGGASTVRVRSRTEEGMNHAYLGMDPIFLKVGGEVNFGKFGTLYGGLRKTYIAGFLKSLSDSFYTAPLVRDFFIKYNWDISPRTQLMVSVLESQDKLEDYNRSGKIGDNGQPITTDLFRQLKQHSGAWQATLSRRERNGGYSEWQGYHSFYTYSDLITRTVYSGIELLQDEKSIFQYRVGLNETGIKYKKTYSPGYRQQFFWGGQFLLRQFSPGFRQTSLVSVGLPALDTIYFNVKIPVPEWAGYIGSTRKLKRQDMLEYSVRGGLLYSGKIRAYLDPHITWTMKPDSATTFIISGDVMHQSYHLISLNNGAFGNDPMVPVNDQIKPFRMIQLDASWQRKWSAMFRTDVSVYYRNLENDYILKPSSPAIVRSRAYASQLMEGSGNIYGAEWMLRKTTGLTTGWISYGFVNSKRNYAEINNGEPFSFFTDRRHTFSLMLINKIGKRNYFTLAFSFMSGNPVTAPLAKYQLPISSSTLNNWNGQYVAITGGTNALRTPWNHRLDIGYQLERRSRWWRESSFNFSLYNVYNSLAIMDIQFRPANGNRKASVRGTTVFPILPSISYFVKF